MSTTDGGLLALMGTEGEKWAREWLRIDPLDIPWGRSNRDPDDDLDTMRGWFANAIETGRSAGQAEMRAEVERLRAFAQEVYDANEQAVEEDCDRLLYGLGHKARDLLGIDDGSGMPRPRSTGELTQIQESGDKG